MEWETINPSVSAEAEFFEILNDFGNPLEIVREAISNAIDAGAKEMDITFSVEQIGGNSRSIIRMNDNGRGMAGDILRRDFWGLGHSTSRGDKTKIGEKGHGTKIFLRSEGVTVRTQTEDAAFESVCDRPLASLALKQLHHPVMRQIDFFLDGPGTQIDVIGYNDNERSKFVQAIARDYIQWFTKMGSIERVFGIDTLRDFRLRLKCLDVETPEQIPFGHVFPKENSDIAKLFETHSSDAAGLYVRREVKQGVRLPSFPEVTFDYVISVEGDAVKRKYNPMLRERGNTASGTYRVLDRYGIWLCKDFIPVERVNEWISSFGAGSNAFTMLHGFVNCQVLKLTANRGTIANTDPKILDELKEQVQKIVARLDTELENNGIYTLRGWQQEQRTLEQEKAEFSRRIKDLRARSEGKLNGRTLLEPRNESELFGLLMTLFAIEPEIFEFEPLDYNTTKGIDLIVHDKRLVLSEHNLGYAELKYYLTSQFNHAFSYLRWIICWEFGRNVVEGTKLQGVVDTDVRELKAGKDAHGQAIYWLDAPTAPNKIHVLSLKQFLQVRRNVTFEKRELSISKA